jgi:pimeloyl-ACP methyl ester carboxylesterase
VSPAVDNSKDGVANPAEPRAVTPRLVEIQASVRLVGERWDGGDPSRPIVLLLHGGGQTRHSWRGTAARLAENGWTSLAIDMRGHGESAWHPDGDYSLSAYVDDLVVIVGTLGHGPVIVGASLGGMAAMTAIGEAAVPAAGLVLVDVVARVEPAGVDRIRSFMRAHPDGFATLQEVADAVARYTPTRTPPRSLDGLRKNVRQAADGRWYWHWDPAVVWDEAERERNGDPARMRTAAERIAVPTLIVRGTQSDVVSEAALEDMCELIPHAEISDVSAGHMVAGDDNDVFTASLERFLGGLLPEAELPD